MTHTRSGRGGPRPPPRIQLGLGCALSPRLSLAITCQAICLAILQNYTLSATAPPHATWSLRKRATRLDDDDEPRYSDAARSTPLLQRPALSCATSRLAAAARTTSPT